ncbi:MAG: right-handed parallel beta-helix repeat-containing protein [Planctomycetota bacterium]|jgi:hypothetical protein
MKWVIIVVLTAVLAGSVYGRTIYVDCDATGANNGTCWADAYLYLQDALTFASGGDEMRVAQGVYRPDEFVLSRRPNMGRAETFALISGVVLKGGYAGCGESDPNACDIGLYETVLSGDRDENDGPNVNADDATRQDNVYHVITCSGADETAVLDGFTITAGNANGPYPDNSGGGVYSEYASPKLSRCIIKANSTSGKGGGINNYWSSPIVSQCHIIGNWAGFDGGGIFNWMGHSIMVNCALLGNIAGSDGGGIFTNHASYELTNCTFSSNSAPGRGGGVFNAKLYGPAELRNCIFFGNDAFEGPEIGLAQAVMSGGATFVDYCNVKGGPLDVYDPGKLLRWGEGNIDADPCFADPTGGDCHLKSQGGRWDPNEGQWRTDDVTSPCIDAGDPMSPVGLEPFPNGGIINMGAYGGTTEASKSYFDKQPCETIVAGDINGDCLINFEDFRLMALHWMEDNAP